MRQFVFLDPLHHFQAGRFLSIRPLDDLGVIVRRLRGELRDSLLDGLPERRRQRGCAGILGKLAGVGFHPLPEFRSCKIRLPG